MKRLILALVFSLLAAPAVLAAPAGVGGILEQAGYLGAWSAHCDAPVSPDNSWQTIAVDAAGKATSVEDWSGTTSEYEITEAARLDQRDLALTVVNAAGETWRTVIRIEADRQLTWSATDAAGKVMIEDGQFTTPGAAANPWYYRCTSSPHSN